MNARQLILAGIACWLVGSIASKRQSPSPTALSEKRPPLGGVSLARATFSRAARSDPYQGLARAPFTGLRVVATRSVGLVESSAASKVAPPEERAALVQPPTDAPRVNVQAALANARNTARRHASDGW